MLISKRWQSKAALLMALGLVSTTALPVVASTPATASSEPFLIGQRFSQAVVPAGTLIPITSDEAETFVVATNERVPMTLTVADNIRSNSGTILIPVGSEIVGEIQPVRGGTQFFADELIFPRGGSVRLDASSRVITETEKITERSNRRIFEGAAVGAGAAAVISEIIGDIDFGEVLIGGGLGALAGVFLRRRRSAEVFVIDPTRDLDLVLESDLFL
ncbi:MAG: hypothetical protein F6K19_27145 [Cyanothece sp. SIO1E1]|nr:hypothetical protein [Cyanothece sp. SIO1E1]